MGPRRTRESLAAQQTAMPWHGGERRQNWATPWPLFWEIQRRYGWGRYTLDPCAEKWSAKVPERFFTAEDNGLEASWGEVGSPGRVFVNPPFDDIEPWIQKAIASMTVGRVEVVTLLVPSRTGMPWWHHALSLPGMRPVGLLGRVRFDPPPDYTGPVSSHGEDLVVLQYEAPLAPREIRGMAA